MRGQPCICGEGLGTVIACLEACGKLRAAMRGEHRFSPAKAAHDAVVHSSREGKVPDGQAGVHIVTPVEDAVHAAFQLRVPDPALDLAGGQRQGKFTAHLQHMHIPVRHREVGITRTALPVTAQLKRVFADCGLTQSNLY